MVSRSSPIKEANKIVANHMVNNFLEEVDSFYMATEFGHQLIVTAKNQIRAVIDASENETSERLLESFCNNFTDNTNTLDECVFDKSIPTPTLKLTLQDQTVFYVQDFTRHFLKL